MHREIGYFPHDFIYLFHTSLNIFSFYNSLQNKIGVNVTIGFHFEELFNIHRTAQKVSAKLN